MGVWQSFLVALDMLRLHKLRAFLTMLGVIIGVMSVTLIVMVSSGFTTFMTTEFKKLGSDMIFVAFSPGRREHGETLGNIAGLRIEDVDYLLDRVHEIDLAAPVLRVPTSNASVQGRKVSDAQIQATDQNYCLQSRIEVGKGRLLTAGDVQSRANVCLIGEEIGTRLFPSSDPVGQLITFDGITLEVIGVMKRIDVFGQSNARDVLLPISTAQDKWQGSKDLEMITLRARRGVPSDVAMDAVWRALMTKSGNKPIYRVDSNESITKVFTSILGSAGVILAAIAALSLLVGGIGIMNIMLVSVTERTKEIGLRKALGARNGLILAQFLVEASTLSVVGGFIGMAIAYLLGLAVNLITASFKFPSPGGLPVSFPIWAAVMATIFSALIGVVFGLFPALSAARLDPIVALRRE